MKSKEYFDGVVSCIEKAYETQRENMTKASEIIANVTREKKNVWVFGCSHAGIIAEEAFYRSGGMVTINPIMFPGFMLNTRPVTMTSKLERLPGLAQIIADENKISEGDVIIIHSVSGRNTVPVELALCAKEKGLYTIALTNIEYSKSVTSRAPCKKNLYEVCDIVIDNCGCVSDASVKIEGLPEKIGPTSTAVGATIINGIIIDAVEMLIEQNITPPVFMSANIDGGPEHNQKILEDYKNNIFYM